MKRTELIASRLREVLLDGRWIANTNYKDQLLAVSWEQAIRKTGNLNTIAALAYHINYYLDGLIRVFEGGPLDIKDQYSFDLPSITSAADWDQLVNTFLRNAEKFTDHVAQLPDNKLDEPFVDKKYGTYLRNIEGVIEHSYYHLGQISLIRKLTSSQNNTTYE